MQLATIAIQVILLTFTTVMMLYSCTDVGNKIRVTSNLNEVEPPTPAQQAIIKKYSSEAGVVIPTGVYRSTTTGGNLFNKVSLVSTVYIDAQKKQFKQQSQGTIKQLGFFPNNVEINVTAQYGQTGKVLNFIVTGGDLTLIKPMIVESVDPTGYTLVEFCDNSIYVDNIPCNNGLAKIRYQKID